MFFAQVPRTNISFTWRIIGTISLVISITNILFLFFKRVKCFYIIIFFYIRYTILFFPFTWVVLFLNNLFSCDRSVWSFLFPVLARNTLFISCYTWYTLYMSRHARNTWIFVSNIYFFGFSYFGNFIRWNGWWNRSLFIHQFYCIFCFSFLSRSWFFQWFTFV